LIYDLYIYTTNTCHHLLRCCLCSGKRRVRMGTARAGCLISCLHLRNGKEMSFICIEIRNALFPLRFPLVEKEPFLSLYSLYILNPLLFLFLNSKQAIRHPPPPLFHSHPFFFRYPNNTLDYKFVL